MSVFAAEPGVIVDIAIDKDDVTLGKKKYSPNLIRKEYAHEALKQGLKYEQKLGSNPFKFGMVGSTDSHTSLDHLLRCILQCQITERCTGQSAGTGIYFPDLVYAIMNFGQIESMRGKEDEC